MTSPKRTSTKQQALERVAYVSHLMIFGLSCLRFVFYILMTLAGAYGFQYLAYLAGLSLTTNQVMLLYLGTCIFATLQNILDGVAKSIVDGFSKGTEEALEEEGYYD